MWPWMLFFFFLSFLTLTLNIKWEIEKKKVSLAEVRWAPHLLMSSRSYFPVSWPLTRVFFFFFCAGECVPRHVAYTSLCVRACVRAPGQRCREWRHESVAASRRVSAPRHGRTRSLEKSRTYSRVVTSSPRHLTDGEWGFLCVCVMLPVRWSQANSWETSRRGRGRRGRGGNNAQKEGAGEQKDGRWLFIVRELDDRDCCW